MPFGFDMIGGLLANKPNLPQFQQIDLGAEQAKSVTANTSNLPGLENLASQTNQFNINQIQSMLRQVIPGYDSMVGGATKNIQDELSGRIPADVSAAVQTSDAARALSGGFAGSGMHGNLVARDLGLTSLDLTQRGISSAQSWLQSMNAINSPGMFNLSSMFVSPAQQAAITQYNNTGQMQHDWAQTQLDSAYDPMNLLAQSFNNENSRIDSMVGSLAGKAAGGAGGGGGGL